MTIASNLHLKVVGKHNMHCGGCASSVEFALGQLPGVQMVRADHETQAVEVQFSPDQTQIDDLRAELSMLGYEVEET